MGASITALLLKIAAVVAGVVGAIKSQGIGPANIEQDILNVTEDVGTTYAAVMDKNSYGLLATFSEKDTDGNSVPCSAIAFRNDSALGQQLGL